MTRRTPPLVRWWCSLTGGHYYSQFSAYRCTWCHALTLPRPRKRP